ncbi:uncharacterized protein LOC132729522 [Ruditapes philippinarum]|uniref:uncharacterized protein LOC132729522 n=1 Tax=Ruditapes philippinarum TaxID=129788 RepID=UPI00295B760E|nr:uncharacterized protein LOC132729522 [Ruditapes philippinarum]
MVFTYLCSADYNQGAECFPAVARGRQCVPSCLMFLLTATYIKPCTSLKTVDLNDIMFAGSFLYCALYQLGIASDFVDPQRIPERISYQKKTMFVTHKSVLSGFMKHHSLIDNQTYYSLQNALLISSEIGSNSIIVFKGVSVGIHKHGSSFYIFDSHSRDEYGLSCSNGRCILAVLDSIQGLITYLQSLSSSLGIPESDIQFDLHTFKFITRYKHTPFCVIILENRMGFRIETIYRRKRLHDKSNELKELRHFLSKRPLIGFVDDRNINCIPENRSCSENTVASELLDSVISQFDKLVCTGPNYVCSCCTQTFFKHYMKNVENLSDANKSSLNRYLTQRKSVGNKEWVCQLCFDHARNGKVPKFWVKNGLQFPEKPAELDLSNLEERLVSPRLPFMQLREMPRGGQVNLKGNIVNVPADVNSTIKSLPRMINENETIMLKLKRKLSYKHHVAFENVRPYKVFEAAKWLVRNSSLFKNEGIVVNDTWLQQPFEITMLSEQENNDEVTSDDSNNNVDQCESDWIEENFMDRPTGNLDTFLQSLDFREFNQILSVAPGEKSSPIGLFQDYHSEVLSFPTLYCGQARKENSSRFVQVHYSDICKWELRNVDRRVALCVPNIFFKLKRLQIKQIRDKVFLAIRKCKTRGVTLTAGDILTPGFIDKLTMQNDGYRVLRTLRGSPPYWEAAKKDVFAMIRQLGIPTWFCSFSAAETKWLPLLKSLAKLVKGRDLSSEEAEELTWQDKCMLIKSDPVTCARFFDHRVQIFIKHVLKHQSQPIGEILDYFYRVEFQQRGSPHIHMIIWINGAPIHGNCSDSVVAEFVSKYVSCDNDNSMPTLINYQTHRHAHTCQKNGKAICRFNFPIPPMPETVILYPLDENERNFGVEAYEKVISFLNDLHKSQRTELEFNDFLAELELDYQSYLLIIRSSLTRPKIFLKRSVSESRINMYNPVLLKCWKANMDIQYVLDAYSCVSYIVSYISKGQRGLSNLLRDACNEARELDSDVRQQVRRIGNQFLSSVEIGAQEAVYLTLQMPLRRCTRDIVYVDSNKPDERTSLIKPLTELKELPLNSKSIEMDNMLKRYKRRPRILQQLCYADFASWYDLCSEKKGEQVPDENDETELPETVYQYESEDNILDFNEIDRGNVITFACGTKVRRRQKQKVIYSNVTSINQDKEEHFRQKIMLYTAWRDEEKDLMGGFETFEQSYHAKGDEINVNKSVYEKNADVVENILENIASEVIDTSINPQAQHEDMLDSDECPSQSATFGCFDPGVASAVDEGYDLGEDLGISRKRAYTTQCVTNEMDDAEYLQCVQKLNIEQKNIFYHILHKVKTQSLPFYTFLSGGAGCGKSVVVRALNQALLKYFNHLRHEDPNTQKLLLCAPTGKAAHNIGGSTIHSSFCIPANQSFQFKPLDMQQLNTMRALYRDLKVIIIDEISMVGRGMLNYINLRLQEIKGCTKTFGNVSVLAVGDLYQLKPVLDSWVFSQVYNSVQLQSLGTNIWVDLFEFFELKEVMRQKDDQEFALLLNRLREGEHTEEDLLVLQDRQVANFGVMLVLQFIIEFFQEYL